MTETTLKEAELSKDLAAKAMSIYIEDQLQIAKDPSINPYKACFKLAFNQSQGNRMVEAMCKIFDKPFTSWLGSLSTIRVEMDKETYDLGEGLKSLIDECKLYQAEFEKRGTTSPVEKIRIIREMAPQIEFDLKLSDAHEEFMKNNKGLRVLALYKSVPADQFDSVRKSIEDVAERIGQPVSWCVYPDSGNPYFDNEFFPESLFPGMGGWNFAVSCHEGKRISSDEFREAVCNSGHTELIGPFYDLTTTEVIPPSVAQAHLEELRARGLPELKGVWYMPVATAPGPAGPAPV